MHCHDNLTATRNASLLKCSCMVMVRRYAHTSRTRLSGLVGRMIGGRQRSVGVLHLHLRYLHGRPGKVADRHEFSVQLRHPRSQQHASPQDMPTHVARRGDVLLTDAPEMKPQVRLHLSSCLELKPNCCCIVCPFLTYIHIFDTIWIRDMLMARAVLIGMYSNITSINCILTLGGLCFHGYTS